MIHFKGRAYCTRSVLDVFDNRGCWNSKCDRFVDDTVIDQAAKAKLPIGWADLMTSKCGYQPKENQQ